MSSSQTRASGRRYRPSITIHISLGCGSLSSSQPFELGHLSSRWPHWSKLTRNLLGVKYGVQRDGPWIFFCINPSSMSPYLNPETRGFLRDVVRLDSWLTKSALVNTAVHIKPKETLEIYLHISPMPAPVCGLTDWEQSISKTAFRHVVVSKNLHKYKLFK